MDSLILRCSSLDSLMGATRGNKTKNYLLSIHFAKKLAMQVRTEKGEQVRNYFLECEEIAKGQP